MARLAVGIESTTSSFKSACGTENQQLSGDLWEMARPSAFIKTFLRPPLNTKTLQTATGHNPDRKRARRERQFRPRAVLTAPYYLQDSLTIFKLVTRRSPASFASASLLSLTSVFSSLASSALVSW